MTAYMPTDPGRAVLCDFGELSQIGATAGGGVDRQAGTAADGDARQWLDTWLRKRGFTVEYDRIGNQFGLLEMVPGAPYVVTGSHLDSQPTAGRFDGAYGVLASAHAAARLSEMWRTAALDPKGNIAVVNWFNEEGSRFKPSMMGSSVYTGKIDLQDALHARDRSGTSVADALRQLGPHGAGAGRGPAAASYIEIHVEQGRELDRAGLPIGLVTSTWSAHKYELVVHGEQSHTGSTSIVDRHDALLGAARIVVAARELADTFAAGPLHSSVSELTAVPNSPVTVAREVRLHLDMRSPQHEVVVEAESALHKMLDIIEQQAAVRIERRVAHSWPVQQFPAEGVKLAMNAADDIGLAHRAMATIAGHDSVNMNELVPTIMLFIPSLDGISHNEREHSRNEDLCAGVDLLTEILHRMLEIDDVDTVFTPLSGSGRATNRAR